MYRRVADRYPSYYKRKNFHEVLSRWFPRYRLERSFPPLSFFKMMIENIRRVYDGISLRIEAQALSANPSGTELGQLRAQLTMLGGSIEGLLPGQTVAMVDATYGGINVDRLHAAQTSYLRALRLAEDALRSIARNAEQESIENDYSQAAAALLSEAERAWAQGDIELSSWRHAART